MKELKIVSKTIISEAKDGYADFDVENDDLIIAMLEILDTIYANGYRAEKGLLRPEVLGWGYSAIEVLRGIDSTYIQLRTDLSSGEFTGDEARMIVKEVARYKVALCAELIDKLRELNRAIDAEVNAEIWRFDADPTEAKMSAGCDLRRKN